MNLAASAALSLTLLIVPSQTRPAQVVSFSSGQLSLQGFLFKPDGPGPFPAVLYNHGSAPGMLNNQAFEAIGPLFVKHGWVFFAPYRRGQGLSAAAGPFIGDEIAAARKTALQRGGLVFAIAFVMLGALLLGATRKRPAWLRGALVALLAVLTVSAIYFSGVRAAAATMVRLLETDHFDDQEAALDWLRGQNFIEPQRIAVAGNSFGGIEAVLGAERLKYCAAINAAGGAESWSLAPALRARMISAARNSTTPIFFFQAGNDYTTAPSRTLSAAMQEAGRPAELKIYPAFGESAPDGHSFTWQGASAWTPDAFRFLDKHCGR